ncbi:MAG TPA: hypothetical protein VFO29_02890 [Candidatus Rubrimentiphilum sp.]|nr:hypothetical protein [Candidatus Rubrimentiphilum sp.]
MKKLLLATAVCAFAVLGLSAQRANAMPPFAQSYGVDCNTCHTMVPALNAYGRYIQRTAYAGLNYHVLRSSSPFWISERLRSKSTGSLDRLRPNFKTTAGNVTVDAVGALGPAWTYRIEQSLYSNNIGGSVMGRAWVGYSNIFQRHGHISVGKLDPAVPSFMAGWQDTTGFGGSTGLSVGKHKYAFSSPRWGARFDYDAENFAVALSWGAGTSGLLQAGDFSVNPGTDKVFDWTVSYANPGKPFEAGMYGAMGGFEVSNKILDRYSLAGFYAQRDPYRGFPGIFAYYQISNDSNPGSAPVGSPKNALPIPVTSHSYAFEIYQGFFNDQIMLGYRPLEIVQSGLGPITRFGNIDFASRIPHAPYLFFNAEASFGGSSAAPFGRPTWQYGLRWAGPIGDNPFKIH